MRPGSTCVNSENPASIRDIVIRIQPCRRLRGVLIPAVEYTRLSWKTALQNDGAVLRVQLRRNTEQMVRYFEQIPKTTLTIINVGL